MTDIRFTGCPIGEFPLMNFSNFLSTWVTMKVKYHTYPDVSKFQFAHPR